MQTTAISRVSPLPSRRGPQPFLVKSLINSPCRSSERRKNLIFAQEEQKNPQNVFDDGQGEGSQSGQDESVLDIKKQIEASRRTKSTRTADSTDAVSSFLTRRFGIGAGFAWLGILTVGALGEQIKTRIEFNNEQQSAKNVEDEKIVTLASGVSYVDRKIGGGSFPQNGFLTVVNLKLQVDGATVQDTRAKKRPFVFYFGTRPYTGGLCAGLEEGLASMRVGGRRIITVPANLGFGEDGVILFPDEPNIQSQGQIPPGATLVYDVALERVSIPPS